MAKAKVTAKKVARKAAVKTTSRKTTGKKTGKKKVSIMEGGKYACRICGLAVTVDTACGCAEAVHLVCCDVPMEPKK